MKKTKILAALLVVMFLLSGCFKPIHLVSGAESIELISNSALPSECKRLNDIDGYSKDISGIASLKDIKNSAMNDLKNNAFSLGADTVVILSSDGGFHNTGGSVFSGGLGVGYIANDSKGEYHIQGVAYKCK